MTLPVVPAQQILRGVAATLSWQPQGSDGEPAAPADTVTVGVTKADGTVVIAAGTATAGSAALPRTVALTAQADLSLLTATWTVAGTVAATTLIEVVGGYWFSVADAERIDPSFADEGTYPRQRLLAKRAEIEADLEAAMHVAWVPRYRRVEVAGTGDRELLVPNVELRAVRSVRAYNPDGVTYTTFAAAELASLTITEHDTIRRLSPWACGIVYVVEYEHGVDRPSPELQAAAVALLRYRMNAHKSGTPDRATSMNAGGVTYSLSTPGQRGVITGLPDVDVVINRLTYPEFGVA